jgi:hypothetical protein
MMQTAERGDCDDPAESLERSMDRCVFAQGQMSPSLVVQRDDGTPTGSTIARFSIRGIRGPGASSGFIR